MEVVASSPWVVGERVVVGGGSWWWELLRAGRGMELWMLRLPGLDSRCGRTQATSERGAATCLGCVCSLHRAAGYTAHRCDVYKWNIKSNKRAACSVPAVPEADTCQIPRCQVQHHGVDCLSRSGVWPG